jgi:HSP20 family protein
MLAQTRWNPFDQMFAVQREFDRLFNQFWSDLPTRSVAPSSSFQVMTNDDEWHIDVPMPGIDPSHVRLDVAGNTVAIRVESGDTSQPEAERYEQTLTVPQFLDLDRLKASHRHGMLRLTLPVRDSVKPRRVEIETQDAKQLTNA